MSDAPPPPRVVLVHGTRMDATEWAAYPPLLPEAEVVAVDLPGHGARLTEEFTAESALETFRAAVDGRSPGQRVILAGHSLGGYLAMLYADRHPGAVDALVLIGASAEPVGPLAGVYRRFADLLPVVGAERMARASNAVMRRLGAGEQSLSGAESYAALPAAWQVVFDECRASLLDSVECPVFLVNGQFDQMRVHARRFAKAGADTRVVTVPRATHLLPITHAEEVAEVLRDALAATGRPAPWAVDFWLDPTCPLTRHTVRWLQQVGEQVPLEICWRVMSLAVLNEHREEDPEGDTEGYLWIPARIAAAVQAGYGHEALGAFYEALWTTPDGRERSGEDPTGDPDQSADQSAYGDDHDWLADFRAALERCGLPGSLADAGISTEHDEALRASHRQGVELIDAEIGTPILRLTAPDGTRRAFFGPVLDPVPDPTESLTVWEALTALVGAPTFRELKA